jgi:hypothetical protein
VLTDLSITVIVFAVTVVSSYTSKNTGDKQPNMTELLLVRDEFG